MPSAYFYRENTEVIADYLQEKYGFICKVKSTITRILTGEAITLDLMVFDQGTNVPFCAMNYSNLDYGIVLRILEANVKFAWLPSVDRNGEHLLLPPFTIGLVDNQTGRITPVDIDSVMETYRSKAFRWLAA